MSSSSNCNTHRRKLLAAALLWPLLPAGARASEPASRPPPALPGIVWRRRGSGVLRRYGFRVYRATLWQGGDETPPALQPPYALVLDYALNLRGEDLARVSGEEMRRLGADAGLAERWVAILRRVFPDVAAGERIVGIHLPDGARFFHQRSETLLHDLGFVADPEFARAFFAIWLNPKSSAAALRQALLQAEV